jgi:hypothetical protein
MLTISVSADRSVINNSVANRISMKKLNANYSLHKARISEATDRETRKAPTLYISGKILYTVGALVVPAVMDYSFAAARSW